MENHLSREWAETILEMQDVCFSEGTGPDTTEITDFIRLHYPGLASKYDYMFSSSGFPPEDQTLLKYGSETHGTDTTL